MDIEGWRAGTETGTGTREDADDGIVVVRPCVEPRIILPLLPANRAAKSEGQRSKVSKGQKEKGKKEPQEGQRRANRLAEVDDVDLQKRALAGEDGGSGVDPVCYTVLDVGVPLGGDAHVPHVRTPHSGDAAVSNEYERPAGEADVSHLCAPLVAEAATSHVCVLLSGDASDVDEWVTLAGDAQDGRSSGVEAWRMRERARI
ncbi:hypothetical protein BRADI_1g26775v3 [Brachypodium distachyon]|uniref:Uncharacterized protein n=1 Tax=Brachypodium distachyon TaxID=15368 RepID=I1GU57_BRADI|nr:hypothetical protein BRADI_1g26775v3 [Brachypodium distachyon]